MTLPITRNSLDRLGRVGLLVLVQDNKTNMSGVGLIQKEYHLGLEMQGLISSSFQSGVIKL